MHSAVNPKLIVNCTHRVVLGIIFKTKLRVECMHSKTKMVGFLCWFGVVGLCGITCECGGTGNIQVSDSIVTGMTRKAGLAWIPRAIASKSYG